MGHIVQKVHRSRQLALIKTHWKFRYCHGGSLRKKRHGRHARPLSTKNAVHLVFKGQRSRMRRGYRSPLGFAICNSVIKRYAKRFFVKVEQLAICSDHIHMVVRFPKRSLGQYFMRVVAGQIAQQLEKSGFKVTDTPATKLQAKRSLWKHRVYSRVTQGHKDFKGVMDYVRLNEMEASKKIPYRKERLRGLSSSEWEILWQ